MADKIVVMHDGIVEQVGAPLELYDRPANTFVATFIGSPAMNMLEGTIGADGASVELACGTRVDTPGLKTNPGRKIVFGIRPEHLTLGGAGIPAEVVVIEPTGADTQVFTKCASGQLSAVFRERHDFHPGSKIFLEPSPEAIHVFDAASGQRL